MNISDRREKEKFFEVWLKSNKNVFQFRVRVMLFCSHCPHSELALFSLTGVAT